MTITNPNTFQFVDYPVFNALVPKEGPRVVPAQFDFTAASSYAVDLSNVQQRGYLSLVQTLFIYNPGTVPVTVTFDVAGQQIVFPPQSEGYVSVLVTNPPKCTVESTGGASNVGVFFINVPVSQNIWPIVTYIPPTTAGLLQVQDTILESIVSGGFANVIGNRVANNDGVKPIMQASVIANGTKNTTGNTLVHTAAAGLQLFISQLDLKLSGDATLAAPGTLTIQLRETATVIAQWGITLPAAAGTLDVIPVAHFENLGFIGGTAAAQLNLNFSAALATGNLFYNIGVGDTLQTQ
jgi:hypothetical protein